jgi:Na+-driven multidrug efflux pump
MTEAATILVPDPTADRPVRPLVELLTLAAPTVAQMASYTFMGFIDTVIVSRYAGPTGRPPRRRPTVGWWRSPSLAWAWA